MNELNESIIFIIIYILEFDLIRGMTQNEYDEIRHEIERLQKVRYNSEMNNVKVIIENELTVKEYQLLQTYNQNLSYYSNMKYNNIKMNNEIDIKIINIKEYIYYYFIFFV